MTGKYRCSCAVTIPCQIHPERPPLSGLEAESLRAERDEWKRRALEAEARLAVHNQMELEKFTIKDDFGNYWFKWCIDCGAEMQVARPGKIQCPNEPHNNPFDYLGEGTA
mgnify:CR=1 FL=1